MGDLCFYVPAGESRWCISQKAVYQRALVNQYSGLQICTVYFAGGIYVLHCTSYPCDTCAGYTSLRHCVLSAPVQHMVDTVFTKILPTSHHCNWYHWTFFAVEVVHVFKSLAGWPKQQAPQLSFPHIFCLKSPPPSPGIWCHSVLHP